MLLLSAALLASMQTTPEPGVVRMREADGWCEMRVDGAIVDEPALTAKTQQWIKEGRQVRIVGAPGTSESCLYSAWQIISMAGPVRIAFMGNEPAK